MTPTAWVATAIRPSLAAAVFGAVITLAGCKEGDVVKTHMTVYLDPQIARDGGLIVMSAIPVDATTYAALPLNDPTAMLDPANPKAAQLGDDDRHFGVILRSPVASVEFAYPADGSYTFNFLPIPTANTSATQLTTERISIGSGGLIRDPETGTSIEWPNVSEIAVIGKLRQAEWARAVSIGFGNAVDQTAETYFRISRFPAGRVIELTPTGIAFAQSGRLLP